MIDKAVIWLVLLTDHSLNKLSQVDKSVLFAQLENKNLYYTIETLTYSRIFNLVKQKFSQEYATTTMVEYTKKDIFISYSLM